MGAICQLCYVTMNTIWKNYRSLGRWEVSVSYAMLLWGQYEENYRRLCRWEVSVSYAMLLWRRHVRMTGGIVNGNIKEIGVRGV